MGDFINNQLLFMLNAYNCKFIDDLMCSDLVTSTARITLNSICLHVGVYCVTGNVMSATPKLDCQWRHMMWKT